ncbi:purple acid phosphatase 15 isoform X1 [Nicotiana tomentosiformis]|uniref:purple acid phosphatase 15 isoform X1 n=1 Tax=Nicotiana tomentosiformis TaxID=4098 RepID=UPI00051C319D|nr:purple acid phosphatase 15 isoform X1 [Nicotiana tomentosiformis]
MKYSGFVVSILVWFLVFVSLVEVNKGQIPTTLDGPFKPVTVPLDQSFRGHAVDLPDTDPRVQRKVKGFEPEQISVSLSSTYDSVWISWITGEYQSGDNIKPLDPSKVGSVVQYGKDKSTLRHKAIGESLIYNQLYPFEGLQNYTSGIIHHVQLTGLKPNTLYYYQCGDPSIPAMSTIYHFKTMPISSPKSYPKRIAIVGDLGLTYNTTSTVSHLMGNDPNLVLLVGDVTYANLYLSNGTGADCYSCSFSDTPIHETYQPRWDYWGRYMQPLVSKIPIMVVEGNHEIEEQAENQTFAAYRSRFAFPSKESGSSSPFYYSFNAGGIHFIMLGGYVAYNKSDDQYKWLERDLANVDRTVTPWLVATWHPPWYSTYTAHYREAECMKVAMEELLYEYGVDLVFNGHVHAYERSNRVYNYTLDPCGPVYITVGDGGNREKMAIEHADEPGKCPKPDSTPDKFMGGFCAYNFTSGPAAGNFCWDQQPDYSAYRESSFGHGILEVKNETHALWTWHRNQDMYNKAGDIIYIVRQPEKCPVKPKVIKPWPIGEYQFDWI